MMKNNTFFFFLSVLLSFPSLSHAQDPNRILTLKSDSIDAAKLEVVYAYSIYDPVLRKSRDSHAIVQIGKDKDLYYDYGYYQEQYKLAKQNWRTTQVEWNQMYNDFNIQSRIYYLQINKAVNTLLEVNSKAGSSFYYEESIPKIEWKFFTDSTRTILDYKCKMATATFRGRKWQVWYTDLIPVSGGPWKLRGVPGFILAAKTLDGEHTYSATTIRTTKEIPMYIRKMSSNFYKTNRRQYNIQLARGAWNFDDVAQAKGFLIKDNNKSERRRLFYNPLETDWIVGPRNEFDK